jgi:hypothetical protein
MSTKWTAHICRAMDNSYLPKGFGPSTIFVVPPFQTSIVLNFEMHKSLPCIHTINDSYYSWVFLRCMLLDHTIYRHVSLSKSTTLILSATTCFRWLAYTTLTFLQRVFFHTPQISTMGLLNKWSRSSLPFATSRIFSLAPHNSFHVHSRGLSNMLQRFLWDERPRYL